MFLTPNDFAIQNGELVKPNDQGYTFVFFFTNDCRWCDDVKPAFNYLSRMIRGVNFAYMDVSQNNWQLRDMSLRTMTPIEYVPLLILFGNGHQIAQFFQDEDNPQNNIPKMQNFIMANTRRQHQQQTSSSTTRIKGDSGAGSSQGGNSIPAYSIGIPGNLASRKVCKLYDNAYVKK
jgi:thiol-disulfide isomerase/thioredoxin